MRQQIGHAAAVADLSAADKQALAAAYTERYSYDKVGNTMTVTDAHGPRHAHGLRRSQPRNLAHRRTRPDLPSQRYDGNGNRVALVDALGHEQAYAYDAMDRWVEPDRRARGEGR